MEQSKQTDGLYDFLYRDAGRIASYYAQLFERGWLASVEETASDKQALEKAGKLSLGIGAGEVKHVGEAQTGSKHVFDPHDLIVTDVLARLVSQKKVSREVASAAHGSLVLVKGTVFFIDGHILKLGAGILTPLLPALIGPDGLSGDAFMGANFIASLLGAIEIPAGFILQTESGQSVAGTLKETGMEEPIFTYYFKHGNNGLAEVHLIGIKESPAAELTIPAGGLISAVQQVSGELSKLLYPANAIRVTPIAMFREI